MTSSTIFTEFARAAEAAGERNALIAPDASLSYSELRSEILALAGRLADAPQEGAVALLTDSARELLSAFFACAVLGRPTLILDPARPFAENRRFAERYGATLLNAAQARGEFVRYSGSPSLSVREVGRGGLKAHDRSGPDRALQSKLPPIASEAEFYWGLTSGTTGEPKLFARSHCSWLESFRAAEQVFAFPPASRILIPGPLSHSLFLYGAVHALCRGHTAIAGGTFRPDRVADAARSADCAYVVPAMLSELLTCGLDDRRLRLIFCGGAKLTPELRGSCEAQLPRADFIEFYGASETSFITYDATSAPAPAGSVGRPFPTVRIEVRAADGHTLPPSMEGVVHVASPMLFSRYVGEASAPEWMSVGDIGFLDEGGFLHLTGRANRIINSRALKIRPEPIEAALLELPGVLRAAVVDLPDTRRGAIVVAAVEFAEGKNLARRILSGHCRSRVGARFSPQRYYHAEAMPMTRNGKVALARLREALMRGSTAFRELR